MNYFLLLPEEIIREIWLYLEPFDRFALTFAYGPVSRNPSYVQRLITWYECLEAMDDRAFIPDIYYSRPKAFCTDENNKGYYVVVGGHIVQYLPQWLYCTQKCPPDHECYDLRYGIPYNDPTILRANDVVYYNDYIDYIFM